MCDGCGGRCTDVCEDTTGFCTVSSTLIRVDGAGLSTSVSPSMSVVVESTVATLLTLATLPVSSSAMLESSSSSSPPMNRMHFFFLLEQSKTSVRYLRRLGL